MVDDILQIYAKDPEMNGIKPDGSKIRVLVVDDSLAFRRLIVRVLTETGYEVVGEVADGKEALLKVAELNPDVITIDVTMPELEGPDAVDVIKRNHPNANIVRVSSMGHQDLVEKSVKKGAKGYILKPLTGEQIPKMLKVIKKAVLG
jgi:two-component system chemotaxis response regulator CheY